MADRATLVNNAKMIFVYKKVAQFRMYGNSSRVVGWASKSFGGWAWLASAAQQRWGG